MMATVSPSIGFTCSKVPTARLIGSMKAASTGETLSAQLAGDKGRHGAVFRERAVTRDPQVAPGHAHVRISVEAVLALPAAPEGIQSDLVPGLDVFDPLPYVGHDTRTFMAHDHGDGDGHAALVLVGQDHEIAEADPRRLHLHKNFTGTWLRDREVAHLHRPRIFPGFHDRFHVRTSRGEIAGEAREAPSPTADSPSSGLSRAGFPA